MLTEDDGSNDGQDRRYLSNPSKYRSRDPDLYDRLLPASDSEDEWDVQNARLWDLVPGAKFFAEPFQYQRMEREQYFSEVTAVLAGSPVIFLDPDIGIAPPSGRKGRSNSDKWVFWDEIEDLYASGHSLVIYQHFPMFKERDGFINDLGDELQERLGCWTVEFHRTANVLFLIAGRPEHEEQLALVAELVIERWGDEIQVQHHFMADTETWVPEPGAEPDSETTKSDSNQMTIELEESNIPEPVETDSDVTDPEDIGESGPDPLGSEPVMPGADPEDAEPSRPKIPNAVRDPFVALVSRIPFRIVRR